MPAASLTPTAYALLGQLALRPWSIYDMTKNIGRTLHWFWPRAESVLYAEVKRLAALGFATTSAAPGSRGRDRTIYAISPAGRRALKRWLGEPPGGSTLHSEPLLRVHLGPYGEVNDLVAALERARADAEALLRQALVIGAEFVEERHQFQAQVHIRAILFDYLWTFGLSMYLWAERWLPEVRRWPDVEGDRRARRHGVDVIARCLADAPAGLTAKASVP